MYKMNGETEGGKGEREQERPLYNKRMTAWCGNERPHLVLLWLPRAQCEEVGWGGRGGGAVEGTVGGGVARL